MPGSIGARPAVAMWPGCGQARPPASPFSLCPLAALLRSLIPLQWSWPGDGERVLVFQRWVSCSFLSAGLGPGLLLMWCGLKRWFGMSRLVALLL